ncbi:MAG: T9SS type A sorting domain-containing protein, partial [Ferruginibacter sp.]
STLKTVASNGNRTTRVDYSTIDENPFDGFNYYRLKQVDLNGRNTISQIEKVYFGDKKTPATVYPNPTKNLFYLKINESIQKSWSYQLYDLSGKLISKDIITQNTTRINLINLTASTYILQVLKDGKKVQLFRIIKTN